MHPGARARILLIATLAGVVAACQPSAPASTQAAASQAGAGTSAGRTLPPGGAPSTSAVAPSPAVSGPVATVGQGTSGSWTVTLSGPMTGAGTHTGSGLVSCTLLDYDGSGTLYWGASMVDPTAPFGTLSNWSMSEEPGSEMLQANVGGLEGGVWVAQSTSGTASVTGSGAPDHTGHVSGQGSFRFMTDGPLFTIAIDASCSDLSDGGGTD